MRLNYLIALCAICATSFYATAQRDNRHEKGVVSILNGDTTDAARVERHLKENAPKSTKDNGLPRFAFVGKDHQYYLSIGAQFLGEAALDWGDEMASPLLFTPSSITPSTPGNRSSLGFAWQSSSVYLNIVAMPDTDNKVGLFFKGNFTGSGNSFSCYHFYAKYRGITVGYTTSLFADGEAEPMTIDFEGPNGYPYITLFNASWTQNFTPNFSGAIGIDAPTTSITTGTDTKEVNQRIPAIPLYLQYAWSGGNSHVRLSGLVRPMQYRNLVKHDNSIMTGWGVQLSGMTEVYGPLSFSFNGAYGQGISNYLQDDNGLGLDAVTTDDPGKMKMVKSMGLTAGLHCALSPKLTSNLVYSHLSNWLPEHSIAEQSQYRYGDYVAANLIYSVNRFVAAGIEYDYGHRKSFSGVSLHTNRLQMQLSVTF